MDSPRALALPHLRPSRLPLSRRRRGRQRRDQQHMSADPRADSSRRRHLHAQPPVLPPLPPLPALGRSSSPRNHHASATAPHHLADLGIQSPWPLPSHPPPASTSRFTAVRRASSSPALRPPSLSATASSSSLRVKHRQYDDPPALRYPEPGPSTLLPPRATGSSSFAAGHASPPPLLPNSIFREADALSTPAMPPPPPPLESSPPATATHKRRRVSLRQRQQTPYSRRHAPAAAAAGPPPPVVVPVPADEPALVFDSDDSLFGESPARPAKTDEYTTIDLTEATEVPAELVKPDKDDRIKLARFQCVICMDAATTLTLTHCGHMFCAKCLHSSLHISVESTRGRCPMCRTRIDMKPRQDYNSRTKGFWPLELKLMTATRKGKRKANQLS